MITWLKDTWSNLRFRWHRAEMVRGYEFGYALCHVIGWKKAELVWMSAASGAKRDYFDMGVEFAVKQAMAMSEGVELVATLEGGPHDGEVVGRCNSYGEWEVFEI